MNECGFWFWFIKPFAEFAAVMAIVFGVAAIYIALLFVGSFMAGRKSGRK